MKEAYKYIIYSIILTVSSQTLIKYGVKNITFNFSDIIGSFINLINLPLVLGLILLFSGSFTFIKALSHSDLSMTFPIMNSLNFLFITLISWIVLKEQVGILRGTGIGFICLGVFLITRSNKK